MGLHLAPAAAEAAWLEPPEYDDPLEHVEFPRERKPWKRDRHAIRSAMNGAINARCQANMTPDGMQTRDHHMRFFWLNHARYEIWRQFFIDHHHLQHPTVRSEKVACLRRCVLAARDFDRPPLP